MAGSERHSGESRNPVFINENEPRLSPELLKLKLKKFYYFKFVAKLIGSHNDTKKTNIMI